jgi:uncharacterized membrane protein YsdA (DUF1294 family)/cold shock CspA family protein
MAALELRGVLKTWDDAKGCGFISPEEGYGEVFLHISAVRGDRRPAVGDELLFISSMDRKGRQRAEHARIQGGSAFDERSFRRKQKRVPDAAPVQKRPERRTRRPGSIQYLPLKLTVFIAACILPGLGLALMTSAGQFGPLVAYVLFSVVAYFMFFDDKRRAFKKKRRVPEAFLHLVELLGGWPGALVSQQRFRHKTRKLSYQGLCWLIVFIHQFVWAEYLFMNGRVASLILDFP